MEKIAKGFNHEQEGRSCNVCDCRSYRRSSGVCGRTQCVVHQEPDQEVTNKIYKAESRKWFGFNVIFNQKGSIVNINHLIQYFDLLYKFMAKTIVKEMFKDVKLESNTMTAQELWSYLHESVFYALVGRIAQAPEKEIQEYWTERMEFVKAVTKTF